MSKKALPLDQIIQGNCIEVLNDLPERSVDLIFADPPLQFTVAAGALAAQYDQG